MKDLRESKKILGIDIIRDRDQSTLSINQTSYCEKVIRRFNLTNARPVTLPIAHHFKLSAVNSPSETDIEHKLQMKNVPYSQAVGSLMYLMISTRPDLSYSASLVSKYMANSGRRHWEATKWIIRYLIWSTHARLNYQRTTEIELELIGYVDSDFAGDSDKRRSLTGYVFLYGRNLISWKAILQSIVALSTTEAEYIALSEGVKERLWLKGLMRDFGIK